MPLTGENLRQALLASGSIPYVMEGIRKIPGFRDRDESRLLIHLDRWF